MPTEVFFALVASLFFASSNVVIKVGLKNSNSISATLVTLIINTVFLWVISILFVPFFTFISKGIIFFIISGMFSPFMGRIFLYTGIKKVGVSIASPLKTISPLFAVTIAVLFLNEPFTTPIFIGIVLTISGVMILTTSSTNENEDKTAASAWIKWRKRDLIFPLASAMLYGTSNVFRKIGVDIVGSSIVGATVATTISFLLFLLIFPLISGIQKVLINRENFLYFSIAGILGGCAQISMISALKWGRVVIASPLATTTQPLFVLLLTFLFLKKSERITFRVVAGAIFVIMGVGLLTAFS